MIHLFAVGAQIVAWIVALSWAAKLVAAAFGLPCVPNLLDARWDRYPVGMPTLAVIVPARNEAADVGATLRSLLAQDYPNITIVAINDRSEDETGPIIEQLAKSNEECLRTIHVTALPEGWLGKTHAMALAVEQTTSDWLLFTDADVLFAPDAIRRSLTLAEATGTDHMVTMPTMISRRWDEGMMLGFFQVLGMWIARPWRISNPLSPRDAIGVGAFNLIRRSAYLKIGGFEAQPMTVLEDVTLGRRVKAAGLKQRLAFGRGLVCVHWASSALGMMRVMTKNLFSVFGFRQPLLLAACLWIMVFCMLPLMGLAVPELRLPAAITMLSVAGAYWLCSSRSGISTWYVLLFPSSSLLFIMALLRSMQKIRKEGGVIWRGTFYRLEDLRRPVAPPR